MEKKTNLSEIENDYILRIFGSGLSLCLIWTFYQWQTSLPKWASKSFNEATCWPFLSNCETWKFLTSNQVEICLQVIFYVGLVTALGFLFKRFVPVAYWLLIWGYLLKLFFYFHDYRLMGDDHFISFLCVFAFIAIPNKLLVLRFLIVGFYVSSGTLKFQEEWLAGLAIPETWITPGSIGFWLRDLGLMPLASAYVLILEVVVVWGLLSMDFLFFWGSFIQILIFHIFSWDISGFFSSSVMFSLLPLFPLYWYRESTNLRMSFGSFYEKPRLGFRAKVFLLIFLLSQLYPKLIPGDTALTGEGRILALNRLDANSECLSQGLIYLDKEIREMSTLKTNFKGGVKVWCDPYVYFYRAKRLCDNWQEKEGFRKMSLLLLSKRSSDVQYKQVVKLENVCDEKIEYSLFYNPWINHEI